MKHDIEAICELMRECGRSIKDIDRATLQIDSKAGHANFVTDCDENGLARCSLRNKFAAGDEIEAVGPDLRPFTFTAGEFRSVEGETLTEVRTPQMAFSIQLPRPVPPFSLLRRQVELSAK